MTRTVRLAGAALVLGFLAAAAAAQDYEIRLTRPMKAGQQFHISATGRQMQKQTVTAGGQIAKSETEEFSVEFETAAKVLEVDKNGDPSKVVLTVGKLVKVQGAESKSLVPKDTVITGSVKDDEPVFEISGAAVDPEVRKALSLVVSLGRGRMSEDQIFGAKDRKKVGDSWNVNAEAVAQDPDLLKTCPDIKKENVSGTMKIERAVKVGKVDCLELQGELTVNPFAPPMPPTFKVETAVLKAKFSAKLPVAVALRPLESSNGVVMTLSAKGQPDPNGPEMRMDATAEQSVSTRLTYPE